MKMINELLRYYFQWKITLLAIFRPVELFDKINQLDWYKNTLRNWVDEQHYVAHSRVLEAGCATGSLAAYIAQSGCRVTGVDRNIKMIDLARIKNSKIDFLVANALNLPYESNLYDAVLATSLINIVSDKAKAIDELFRICKKGGSLAILVPSAEFNDEEFVMLKSSIGVTGFSLAALQAWHRRAPKMETGDIVKLFEQTVLDNIKVKMYLKGMLISVSATKPF